MVYIRITRILRDHNFKPIERINMNQNETVLVLGASGTVGSELVKLLRNQGHHVITTSRKAGQPEVGSVYFDLVSGQGLDDLFKGVHKAFILSPPGYTNQDQLLIPVITKAKESGVKKIVLMTAMGADADPNSPFRKTEVFLENSGLNYNIIRPNWFMQNFNTFWVHGIKSDGKIFLPVGDAKGSFIDARDIAAVAHSLLLDKSEKFNNQAFNITGSESLDHHQVARILTEVTGKEIRYTEISAEQMLQNLLGVGLPKDYAQFLITILGYFKMGYSQQVLPTVEDIIGRKPILFEQYAKDYKQSF